MKKLLTIVITVVLAITCCFTTACIRIGVNDIKLDKTNAVMEVGEELTLNARFDPENASNKDLTWASTNKDVATVSKGKVTALKAGWTVVWVKTVDGGKIALCNIIVTNNVPVTGVTLDETSVALDLKNGPKICQLNATVLPLNAKNQDISWSSTDKNVASVSANGRVTARRVGATAIIATSKDSGHSAVCTVVVTNGSEIPVVNPTGITLSKTTASLTVGGTVRITATVTPSDATNKTVTWTSLNTSVATVNNGLITAVSEGTATIKATVGTNISATCTVTVTKADDPVNPPVDPNPPVGPEEPEDVAVTGVTLNKTTASLVVGNSTTLIATVSPSNATNKAVTWMSLNTSVATVNSNGKVTGVSAGTAAIMVTTVDGEEVATCMVTVTEPEGGDVAEDFANSIELIPDEEAEFYEGKLKIRAVNTDSEKAMLETLIEAFNEKFPYIEVEVSYILQDQYYNQVIYDTAAGSMSDVFWIAQDYIDQIVGQNNIIASLNLIDERDTTFSTDVLVEEAVACSSLKDANGVEQLYMIPRDYNEVVMYYNVDMFEEAGIELPDATEPMTKSKFDTMVRDLREYYGKAAMPKVIDVNTNWDSFAWPLLKSFGAKIIDEQGNVMLDSQATKDALLYWRELFNEDIVPPSTTMSTGVMFYMGQAPIYFHSRAELTNIISSDEPGAPTNIGVAPVPQFGDTYAVGGGSSGYAMYKGTKNATEAWAFLKFIASEEAQEAMGTSGSSVPSLKSMLENYDASWRQFTHERLSDEYFDHDSFLVARDLDGYTTTRDFFDYMPIGVQKDVIDCIAKCFQAINDNLFSDDDLTFFNNQIALQQQDIINIITNAKNN